MKVGQMYKTSTTIDWNWHLQLRSQQWHGIKKKKKSVLFLFQVWDYNGCKMFKICPKEMREKMKIQAALWGLNYVDANLLDIGIYFSFQKTEKHDTFLTNKST